MTTLRHRRRGAAAARVLLPLIGVSLLLAGLLLASRERDKAMTVSAVTRRIQEIALAGGDPAAERGADDLGPWRLSVRHIEPLSGHFIGLTVISGRMIIAAESAQLRIDPDQNTFTFEMSGVTMTRVPDEKETEAGFIHELEHYVLGPAPFGIDIVPDGGDRRKMPPAKGSDLAGVDDYAVRPE